MKQWSSWQLTVSSWREITVGINFSKRRLSHLRFATLLLLSAYCCLPTILAQPGQPFYETSPPPLKVISKAEKSQLDSASDIKERTKLALELIEMRLLKAEDFDAKEQFAEMFTELGSFHALIDDTINFLNEKNNNSGKILNNFKRIELSLRKYITRLELIRRDLPIKYELYVRSLVKRIREARSKAVEPLFDDTVVPDKKKG